MSEKAQKTRHLGLSVPDHYRLSMVCERIRRTWDEGGLYLVGSAMKTPQYRDVDVRLMLPDDRFAALGDRSQVLMLNAAMSDWLASMTGLPIDFQFQDTTATNAEFDGPRSALGIVYHDTEPGGSR